MDRIPNVYETLGIKNSERIYRKLGPDEMKAIVASEFPVLTRMARPDFPDQLLHVMYVKYDQNLGYVYTVYDPYAQEIRDVPFENLRKSETMSHIVPSDYEELIAQSRETVSAT